LGIGDCLSLGRESDRLHFLLYFVNEVFATPVLFSMTEFLEIDPTTEDYWRSIILYGQNAACYKFALGKALLEIARTGKTFTTLEELSEPFSRYVTEHLKLEDKQGTSKSSKFLDACRRFNAEKIERDELIATTIRYGFENVIDAFHNVNQAELPVRFFTDERKNQNKGIILTDNLLKLPELYQGQNLPQEIEARWRLVETAWKLKISKHLIKVDYDHEKKVIFTGISDRRVDVTSCRDALNGYQKGKCFYCFADISIFSGSVDLGDVDHFFPRKLMFHNIAHPIDGVWNLVLACQSCNRGIGGKFDRLPQKRFLKRLHQRNEFFINSHHPLRETLIQQTGTITTKRIGFLNDNYRVASTGALINSSWQPEYEHSPAF
jgi:hypothetical protein